MLNIAEILKQEREKRGISLEDISKATSISIYHLQKIEEGDLYFIEPVYVKAFIKAYMKHIKYTNEELLKELDKVLGLGYTPIAIDDEEMEEEEKRIPKFIKTKKILERQEIINYVIYFIIFVGVLLIFYFTIFKPTENTQKEVTKQEIKTPDTTKENTKEAIEPFIPQKDSLIIELKALDSCWINVEIDLKRSESSYLTKGQVKRISADSVCKFHIGNAANVDIYRNGKLLEEIPKKRTSYRNLIITKTQVILPAWLTDTTRVYQKKKINQVPQKQEKHIILQPSNIDRTNPLEKRREEQY